MVLKLSQLSWCVADGERITNTSILLSKAREVNQCGRNVPFLTANDTFNLKKYFGIKKFNPHWYNLEANDLGAIVSFVFCNYTNVSWFIYKLHIHYILKKLQN